MPQPAAPYKRFSPFKAGAYQNNGSSNVYLNSNVNMVEANRRVSSQEKYSKVDNSCPRSFQSKVSNVLECLVTQTLEDELERSPGLDRGQIEFTFENQLQMANANRISRDSSSQKNLDSIKSYEHLDTTDLMRVAN